MNLTSDNKYFWETIRVFWGSYLWCGAKDLLLSGVKIRYHSNKKKEIEIHRSVYGAIILLIPEEFFWRIQENISPETNLRQIQNTMQDFYHSSIEISGPVSTQYLFDPERLKEKDHQVFQLSPPDREELRNFIDHCDPKDVSKVDMDEEDFENPFYGFYWYRKNGELVSVGNMQRETPEDVIVNIGLITRSDARGKGYASNIANNLLHTIFEQGWIPQYRTNAENAHSCAIAQSFGFEEFLRSYYLSVV